MTNDDQIDQPSDKVERPLDRRVLLRGGAVLAGAAGVTAIGAAMGSSKAEAADGQFMVVGQPNSCESTTAITLGGNTGGEPAALTLKNLSGPALRLEHTSSDYSADLLPGEIASTPDGLALGVGTDALPQTTWIVTERDLEELPFTLPVGPVRLVDTRILAGRAAIKSTSPNAFDSSFRLKAGAWMDVGIIPSEYFEVGAVYVNVTAVKPVKNGVITAYPPGDRPIVSTLNFVAGQTIANGAFTSTGVAKEDPDWVVIRIHSNAVTHVVVDLTGVLLRLGGGLATASVGGASQRRAAKTNRIMRHLTR